MANSKMKKAHSAYNAVNSSRIVASNLNVTHPNGKGIAIIGVLEAYPPPECSLV